MNKPLYNSKQPKLVIDYIHQLHMSTNNVICEFDKYSVPESTK